MSYVAIYMVDESGDVRSYGEAHNNHGYAPMVWQYLTVQYGLHPTGKPYDLEPVWNYKPLWGLFNRKERLSPSDRLLLASTFDAVWIKREDLPPLVEALRAFDECYIQPNRLVRTMHRSAEVIETLLEEFPSTIGAAFDQCSASQSFWKVLDSEDDEECRPYNVFKDTEPGWVFEG